jgi:mitogen-activated protein kinase kinase kinase
MTNASTDNVANEDVPVVRLQVDGEENKSNVVTAYIHMLDEARVRHRKLRRFARYVYLLEIPPKAHFFPFSALSNRFSNSCEYNMSELNVALFINRLVETGHQLVFAENYQKTGTFIIAEGPLAERKDQIANFFKSAFQVVADQPTSASNSQEKGSSLPSATASSTKDQSEADLDGVNSVSGAEDDSSIYDLEEASKADNTKKVDGAQESSPKEPEKTSPYLIVFKPKTPMFWHGKVLLGIDIPSLDLGITDKRLLLISEGGQSRLASAKSRFAGHFIYEDESRAYSAVEEDLGLAPVASASPVGTLPVQTDQRSHLPDINKELARVTRATNRLAFKIVESIHPVRKALIGVPGYQDLLQNWFLFAAEHAHQQSPGAEFSRALTNLAISWVTFICDDCDSTDRKTFKWAVTALEFAKNRVGDKVILQLPTAQFVQLRRKVAMCMSLLIRHFDILGARSSNEEKQARERQEELRRQLALEARLQTEDDQYLKDMLTRDADNQVQSSGFVATVFNQSLRTHQDDLVKLLAAVERSRDVPEGRVLDDNVPEDRTLFLLASSHSNVSIRWQQGKLIGRGAFGSVYLASNMDTGQLMAVKEIHFQDVAGLLPSLYKSIKDELSVMEMLRHPHIVEYYGIEVHRDRVYIFEEYCQGGSLANLLDLGRIEDEIVLQMYALQMLDGLIYLHSRNIVHRDIKPDSSCLICFVD